MAAQTVVTLGFHGEGFLTIETKHGNIYKVVVDEDSGQYQAFLLLEEDEVAMAPTYFGDDMTLLMEDIHFGDEGGL